MLRPLGSFLFSGHCVRVAASTYYRRSATCGNAPAEQSAWLTKSGVLTGLRRLFAKIRPRIRCGVTISAQHSAIKTCD